MLSTVIPFVAIHDHGDGFNEANYGCAVSTRIINRTPCDIWTVDRNNVYFSHKGMLPSERQVESGVVIRTVYQFNGVDELRNCYTLMSRFSSTVSTFSPDFKAFMALAHELLEKRSHHQRFNLVFDRFLRLSTIRDLHCVVLEESSDIAVILAETAKLPPHPYSPEGRAIGSEMALVQNKVQTSIAFEIVDNDHRVGDRFLFVANRVLRVKPNKNPSLPDGVYMSITEPTGKNNALTTKVEKFEFEEAAEKIGLHRTKEEATTAGNPQEILKERDNVIQNERLTLKQDEIVATRQQNEVRKDLEAMRFAAEQGRIQLQQEAEANALKLKKKEKKIEKKVEKERSLWQVQIEKLKHQSMKMKEKFSAEAAEREHRLDIVRDDYERRSHARKDTSETLKFLPALLAVGASLFAIFKMA